MERNGRLQIERIKNSVSLESVIRYYCPDNKIIHGRCKCPIHNGDRYSMAVYDKEYHCFQCGAHGDIIQFVKTIFDIDFKTALCKIDTDFNLGVIGSTISKAELSKIKKKKAEIREKTEKIQKATEEYWKAFDEWFDCKKVLEDEPVGSDAWVKACNSIDLLEFELDRKGDARNAILK